MPVNNPCRMTELRGATQGQAYVEPEGNFTLMKGPKKLPLWKDLKMWTNVDMWSHTPPPPPTTG